ncbi:hypothetical protein LNKW23_42150 [Paralimibaculum aggregatum]|uniref:Beta-ketoacyl synthase-like N-terminal domain-containing protein n=1 Tax=Paralimibaculum aggregatum TaxID=3036245 RepID=A0ABQ6LSE5_9RHOB|nr:beta-ketoacyl synthase chain length factor [Limibaculum sp. NKW23]GMG84999.1 hypothetical protein LNKW23_42150 [Limibaculum sp. NKW23]
MKLSARIGGVGLAGPGLADWPALSAAIAGAPWAPEPGWQPQPACLPSRAARRLSPTIRLALMAAEQIGPALPAEAAWVFASSVGEGETLNVILEALRAEAPAIQPLRFQNAVHNAAAGQWSIAAGLRGPSTSLAAHDDTAGAALLKALMQLRLERLPVGLVVYDAPMPPPLHEKRPFGLPLAVALALVPEGPEAPGLRLSARLAPAATHPPTPPGTEIGRALAASGNPAAALLPLLELLAAERSGVAALGLQGTQVLALGLEAA